MKISPNFDAKIVVRHLASAPKQALELCLRTLLVRALREMPVISRPFRQTPQETNPRLRHAGTII